MSLFLKLVGYKLQTNNKKYLLNYFKHILKTFEKNYLNFSFLLVSSSSKFYISRNTLSNFQSLFA